ncbi:MAG: hypothetical protein JHC87_05940 [Thermoleophilaceae bacterium]|nr:hypothetical protein [Thermoleophilaceae bacterium]
MAVTTTTAWAVLLASRTRQQAARFTHEVRGALAGACISLEAGERPDQWDPTEPARIRFAVAELQRASRLLKSLEESAARSLLAQLAYLLRQSYTRLCQRRMARHGSFSPRTETLRVSTAWRASAARLGRNLDVSWQADNRVVHGCSDLYIQALSNLLANALRHGDGDIEVRAEATSSVVRIAVTDHGDGLASPLNTLLKRSAGGEHGHGLPISAAALRSLGGRLSSAPSPHGARLVMELPLAVDLVDDGENEWYTSTQKLLRQDAKRNASRRSAHAGVERVIPLRRR